MKTNYLLLYIIPLLIHYSCTQQSTSVEVVNQSNNKQTTENYQQITFTIDTLSNNYVVKELLNFSEIALNEDGEVASATQTNFSFENQKGTVNNTKEIYSPESQWHFIHRSEYDPIINKYYHQSFSDTIINEKEYTFQYNKRGQLIVIKGFEGFKVDFIYNQNGQWTQITKHFPDERSGQFSYEITKRENHQDEVKIIPEKPTYLSVNGEDVFEKKKKSIVDYYILSQKAAIFSHEGYGGQFDIPNGFFQYEDDGTGGGVYTGQLVIFKTNEGKDIIAINGFYGEAVSFYYLSGDRPKFYVFENNVFTESTAIFPEVDSKIFFDGDYTGSAEGINTYFTLPQKGLSIQYIADQNLEKFCNEMDANHSAYDVYKDICKRYSKLKRTSIEIAFDKVSGTFKIKNQ